MVTSLVWVLDSLSGWWVRWIGVWKRVLRVLLEGGMVWWVGGESVGEGGGRDGWRTGQVVGF